MVSCVFNLQYLSQNLVKLDQKISNLPLVLKIDQDLWW